MSYAQKEWQREEQIRRLVQARQEAERDAEIWKARAAKAEKIAAAERALRKTEVGLCIEATDRAVCGLLALDADCQEARRTLAALGEEP